MAKTKHEKYEVMEIEREKISLAKYNPRVIDAENKKALEKGLKEHGLVEPLVWNKRTGNLVSGHQRISILDKLERGTDYELTVSVIDVDEAEEALLNVKLNNKSMQGDFDFELLGGMALDMNLSFEDMGFSEFDINMMFGDDDRFKDMFKDSKTVEATKDEIKAIKEHRENMAETYDKDQNADFYFIVVCDNQKQKDELLREMSVPIYEKYVTAKHVRRLSKGE